MQNDPSTLYKIEPLGHKHDRQGFSSGVNSLDRYFKLQAGQDARNKVAVTFVLLKDNQIAGYYSLSNTSIPLAEFPEALRKKLPKYSVIPATLIGRLARDERFKSKGIGEILLMDALNRSLLLSQQIASFAVIVDAENQNAQQFYLKYKFIPFADKQNRLYLPLVSIEKLVV